VENAAVYQGEEMTADTGQLSNSVNQRAAVFILSGSPPKAGETTTNLCLPQKELFGIPTRILFRITPTSTQAPL